LPREPRANISQLLKKLEQENPEEYARLCELRKNDRQAFFQEIRRLSRPQPSENSQKLFANEAECRRLAGEIRACEDAAKKQELLEQLRLKLKEAHQLAVEEFAARLNNLQQQLASMQENAEAIQEKRLQILLQEEQPEHGRPGAFPPPPPPPAGNPQDGDNPPPPPPAPEK
jgi:putative heme degradation protein